MPRNVLGAMIQPARWPRCKLCLRMHEQKRCPPRKFTRKGPSIVSVANLSDLEKSLEEEFKNGRNA